MKSLRTIMFLVPLILALAGCNQVAYSPPEWKIGDWVEYQVKGGSLRDYTLRYAVTGADTIKGEPYYWLEMTGRRGGMTFIYKMLVPYGYRGVAERMIIKVGNQPAQEMPDFEGLNEEPPGEIRPYLYIAEQIDSGRVEVQTVQTPAGEYKAVYATVRDITGRENKVWVRADVPIFGMVAQETPSLEMKLVATGTDATTAITEEPVRINPDIFHENDGR